MRNILFEQSVKRAWNIIFAGFHGLCQNMQSTPNKGAEEIVGVIKTAVFGEHKTGLQPKYFST